MADFSFREDSQNLGS